MTIIGIDPSLTSTGIAIIDEKENIKHFALKTKVSDGTTIRRILSQIFKFKNFLKNYSAPHYFFMEDYAYGVSGGKGGKSKLATMGEVSALYKLTSIHITGKEPYPVPIGSWKSFLCGKGNLKSDSFKLEVFKKYNISCDTNDEAVAIAIADFGYAFLYKKSICGAPLTKYQEKAIEKFCTRVQK